MSKTSKMQKILDKVETAVKDDDMPEAVAQLVEAIKLLSLGQQQLMDQVDRVRSRNPFVGGCD